MSFSLEASICRIRLFHQESRNLAQRAAELESALEQSMRRERELAQKLTTKETDDRRSDAQQVNCQERSPSRAALS